MPERVLVTGGAGFIGSSLGIAIKRSFPHLQVTAFDNLRRRGSDLNLGRLKDHGITFLHGDVRVREDVLSIKPLPTLIVECSAEPSAQAGYAAGAEYLLATNLNGCLHCLELARLADARFLFLSTSRVYPYRALNALPFLELAARYAFAENLTIPGVSSQGVAETFPLEGPRSLYGMTKLAAELAIQEFADAYGIPAVINRCGVVAGPWQMGKTDQGFATLWLASHVCERPLRYIGFGGTGKQVRDILHVDDLTDLLLDQIAHFDSYVSRVLNVGGGPSNSISLLECSHLCQDLTGKKVPISSETATRPADVRIYQTDTGRVQLVRGWQPKRDLHLIFRDICEWIRAHRQAVERALF